MQSLKRKALSQPPFQSQGKSQLHKVRDHKGEDAPAKNGKDPHTFLSPGVKKKEPGSAKGIKDHQPQEEAQEPDLSCLSQKGGDPPIGKSHGEKAQDVAAGIAKKYARAGAKLGEYRDAGSPQGDIDQDGDGTPFAAQGGKDEKYNGRRDYAGNAYAWKRNR